MSKNEQINRVRTKLEAALSSVRDEIIKCHSGQAAVDSEETLRWIAEGLENMLSSLETNARLKPPGFWHVISDGWPSDDALRRKIIDAEYSYERLK